MPTRYLITFLIITGILVHSPVKAQGTISIDNLLGAETTEKSAELVFGGETLFRVQTYIGPFSPKERVDAIQSRLQGIVMDPTYKKASTYVVGYENTSDIYIGDKVLMAVSEEDAKLTGKSRAEVAESYRIKLDTIISQEQENRSLKEYLKELAAIIILALAMFCSLYLTSRIFYLWIYSWIKNQKNKLFKGIKINNYELMTPSRQVAAILLFSRFLRVGLLILIIALFLPLFFSIFPFTKGFAIQLWQYILHPIIGIISGIIRYIPNILTILVIFLFTHYLLRLLHFIAREVEREAIVIEGFYPDWSRPTFNIIRTLAYIFMFIVIYPYLPFSESPIFKGVSILLGLLLSLGSTSAVSNVVAGLVLTYMRPFQIGDRVQIGEVTGDILEKNLLVIRLLTIKNENITLSNSFVLSNHTINYSTVSKERGLVLHTSVTIGYDTPWRMIHNLLLEAANNTSGILKDMNPFVLQKSLDDFYVTYELNAYTDQPAQMVQIYSELHQNIQDAFNQAGVEILSPHYRSVRNGNSSLVVEVVRSQGTDSFSEKDSPDKVG